MHRKRVLLLSALVIVAFIILSRSFRTRHHAESASVPEGHVTNRRVPREDRPGQSEELEIAKQNARAELDAMIATNPHPQYARYYLEQSRTDRLFDWKQSISFYGKVVDQNEQGVEAALVQMSWNDLSEE